MTSTTKPLIPETGEWVLSPEPNSYVVVMTNDTPFLTQYDRVAVMCSISNSVGEEDPDSEYQTTTVKVHGLRPVVGCVPGVKIKFDEDCNSFLAALGQRIGDALNNWIETTSEERRGEIWAMGNTDPLELLLGALTGKFKA